MQPAVLGRLSAALVFPTPRRNPDGRALRQGRRTAALHRLGPPTSPPSLPTRFDGLSQNPFHASKHVPAAARKFPAWRGTKTCGSRAPKRAHPGATSPRPHACGFTHHVVGGTRQAIRQVGHNTNLAFRPATRYFCHYQQVNSRGIAYSCTPDQYCTGGAMCGILAALGVTGDAEANRRLLLRQSRLLRHRGPDSSGVYEDPKGRAFFSFERLNIVDPSDNGRHAGHATALLVPCARAHL